MLTHHRKSVCLSLISTDLPIWSVVEAAGTLYQKDQERFHLLLTEPVVQEQSTVNPWARESIPLLSALGTPRLLWLEISPYRVVMTVQGNGKFSYRHAWEQGVYGLSRYWLQNDAAIKNGQLRLRNYTRQLFLRHRSLPDYLRVEYELWSNQVQLGCYVLNLEMEA